MAESATSSREVPASSGSRGAFIVFEGLDRSGKSTQCARVAQFLKGQGIPVQELRFPDRSTPVGQEISQYLASTREIDNETIHNLFSKNRWEKKDEMEALILSGQTLVVDRYAFSGVAYSAAKGMDFEQCKVPDSGLLSPDLVIFLDINPEAASGRGEYGAERYEKIEFQQKVAEQYRRMHDASWKVLDASLPLEDVTKEVLKNVVDVMEKCGRTNALPLGRLWMDSRTAA